MAVIDTCLRLKIEDIQFAAMFCFPSLAPGWLTSHSRQRRHVWPRQVAMTVARRETSKSLPYIGQYFGGRDHTTVIHALRAVAEREQTDTATRTAVEAITALAYRRAEHRLSVARSWPVVMERVDARPSA